MVDFKPDDPKIPLERKLNNEIFLCLLTTEHDHFRRIVSTRVGPDSYGLIGTRTADISSSDQAVTKSTWSLRMMPSGIPG